MNIRKTFCSVVLACASTASFAVPFPGPDGGGYKGSTIGYNFRDISGTGLVALESTVDEATGAIGMGFDFSFYGNPFSEVYIATNGYLSFDDQFGVGCGCSGEPLGAGTGIANLVAVFNIDWETFAPGAKVYYQTIGSVGSREFIVQWNGVNAAGDLEQLATFEAILHEGSNDIEFQYLSATNYNYPVTIGIQNGTMTTGLSYVEVGEATLAGKGLLISNSNVPEPGTLALLGLGMFGLVLSRRKKA